MKRIVGRIIAYTVLYCGVVFSIFVLQFTKGQFFSASLGAMIVTGRQEHAESGKDIPLLPLHVVSNGLELYVSEQDFVYAIDEADKKSPLRIISYQFYETEPRFSVHCSDDVTISFFSEKRGEIESFSVEAVMPNGIKKIAIPWRLTRNAGVERTNGKIFARFGNKQYAFVGSFGFNADVDAAEWSGTPHVMLDKAQPIAYYKTYVPLDVFDITAVPSMEAASAESYESALKTFSTAVLHAGTQALSSKKYTEPLLTAYIAEMGQCGAFAEAIAHAPAQTLSRSMRTYLSNPFYGNVQGTHAGLVAADAEKRKQYVALIAARSPEIFEHEDIIPFLTDRGVKHSAEEFFRLVETVDASKLTARQAVGVLAVWLDCIHYYPEQKTLLESMLPLCEKIITESLLLIDGGLYISDEGSYVDTFESLISAHILMRYGTVQSPVWQSISRMLVTTLLRYSGASAGLPVGFTVTGSKTTKLEITADDSKMLDAGVLYPLVMPDTSWYPHAQSLALQAEPGVWAWTCAQSVEVLENTAKTLVLRVRFPEGQSHYLTLHGIRPFHRIEMYGIPFRSDARFEMYDSSGYAYNDEHGILYVKMKHKSEYEVIRLSLSVASYQVRAVQPSRDESAPPPQTPQHSGADRDEEVGSSREGSAELTGSE